MSSATDGWATGTSYTNNAGYYSDSALLLHYTRGNWTEVKPISNTNNAGAISMSSASDGWAVGDSEGDNGLQMTDLLHYNGQQWTTVPAFTSRSRSVVIVALQMLSATEGWAVGSSITYGSQHDSNGNQLILSWKAVIVHYHNGAWSIVPTS